MQESARHLYEFGQFQLDPEERRLLRDGQAISLTPKAFDTLVILVEQAGKLVEKEALMSALWPDSFVEEGTLNQNIWTVRKALGEAENGQRYIETVPRKGFRFVADVMSQPEKSTGVEKLEQSGRNTRTIVIIVIAGALAAGIVGFLIYRSIKKSPPNSALPPKTLAVLPFKPLSADRRNESLEMGMTETLITRLSNLKQIVVRPISSVRKYSDPQQDPIKAGQELQTDLILDGSLQETGDRVRVTVRLTRVTDKSTLWAEQFDEKATDILKVQDSIADRVATTLPLKLSGEERQLLAKRYTDSPEAYEVYLQGLYYRQRNGPGDKEKSMEYYQRAISKDPKFALAYVQIAELEMSYAGSNKKSGTEVIPEVTANLRKALELDDSLAEAHNLMAEVKYQIEFDWEGAEKEFTRAIDLNPNLAAVHQAYGYFLMCEGRFDPAMAEIEKARQIDPSSLIINVTKGRFLYYMRQFDVALAHDLRLIELEPKASVTHWATAKIYEQKGMYAQAVEEIVTAGHFDGLRLTPEEIVSIKEAFKTGGWPGFTRMRNQILQQRIKEGYVSPFSLAISYLEVGDKDRAFAWLEKAIDARASGVSALKVDPNLDNLRADARFVKLLAKMNLTP